MDKDTIDDFIRITPPKKDKVIRKIYTPKEIVWIIQKHFNDYMGWSKLSRSEMLLLWEFSNMLIREFKDD